MKALFELFRRFDARRIFGFIRRLGGMSRPKVKCYDLRSTRALRVEGDLNISDLQMSYITFLSTPSGWRATRAHAIARTDGIHFYPRPPGGGRQQKLFFARALIFISIHALRVEGDPAFTKIGATHLNFYPRPPGGGRRTGRCRRRRQFGFLSTPSGWRATGAGTSFGKVHMNFYPRPPGGGRRVSHKVTSRRCLNFYPRPPGGGRRIHTQRQAPASLFLSTPSGWRATRQL